MTRFMTFLALMVGGMEAIQPARVPVLAAGLTPRMRLGLVGVDPYQRRQGIPLIPSCDSLCTPITGTLASNASQS
jgi:hypothetical protein